MAPNDLRKKMKSGGETSQKGRIGSSGKIRGEKNAPDPWRPRTGEVRGQIRKKQRGRLSILKKIKTNRKKSEKHSLKKKRKWELNIVKSTTISKRKEWSE